MKIKSQNGEAEIIVVPIIIIIALASWGLISTFFLVETYHNLTKEGYIATLWFKPVESNKLEYLVEYSFDKTPTKYKEDKIYGDQFRLDAQFEKRPYWLASIFGEKPMYAVSRIEGRYSSPNDENTMKHLAVVVNDDADLKPFTIFGWAPFVDVTYGSSVYDKIDTRKMYQVFYTQTGIICRTSDIPSELKDKGILNEIKNFF